MMWMCSPQNWMRQWVDSKICSHCRASVNNSSNHETNKFQFVDRIQMQPMKFGSICAVFSSSDYTLPFAISNWNKLRIYIREWNWERCMLYIFLADSLSLCVAHKASFGCDDLKLVLVFFSSYSLLFEPLAIGSAFDGMLTRCAKHVFNIFQISFMSH